MSELAPRAELRCVAHDLRSLHNVGAIFRTADGAGFDQLLLSGFTGCPPDPRISKVALGAEQDVPWRQIASLDGLLAELEGDWVVLLEQHPGSVTPQQLLTRVPSVQRVTLVVCEELFGAPDELRERADCVLELPMHGTKESLNVSVAFGIAAYALVAAVRGDSSEHLRSRQPARAPRPGVLTNGPTTGETPRRPNSSQAWGG